MYTGKLTPQLIDPLRLEQGVKFLHAYPLLQEASVDLQPSAQSAVLTNSLYGIQISEQHSSTTPPRKRKNPTASLPPENVACLPKQDLGCVDMTVSESPYVSVERKVSCSPSAPSVCPPLPHVQVGLVQRTASRRKHYTCSHCGSLFTQRSQLREHMVLHMQQGAQPNLTTYQQGEPISSQTQEQELVGNGSGNATPDSSLAEPEVEEEMAPADIDVINSDGELPALVIKQGGDSTPPPSDIADIDHLEEGSVVDASVDAKRRRFQCPTCGRKFLQRSHWREHMYTHTGKPYRCSACHKSFCRASQAARHTCRLLSQDAYTMVDPQCLLLCDGVDGSQTEALFLPSSRPYKCQSCAIPFSSPAEVFKHHCSQAVTVQGFLRPQDATQNNGSRDTSPVLPDCDES